MAEAKREGALSTIFSFFLGLIVSAFVGVGVYTFHEPPETNYALQIEKLDRQERELRDSRPADALLPADRDQIRTMNEERDRLQDSMRAARNAWGRSTSIILIVLATLAMAISLVRADRLPVISNGLLLGGIFTMLYGVGWIVATDSSVIRFLVMTAALGITLGLGYVRFVRRGTATPSGAGAATDLGKFSELDERVRELEQRLDRAADILGQRSDR